MNNRTLLPIFHPLTILAIGFTAVYWAPLGWADAAATAVDDGRWPTTGSVERLDPAIDRLIPKSSRIEVLCAGFEWSEGPVWIRQGGYLLFSDVPTNKIYRWKEGEGKSLYLTPSPLLCADPHARWLGRGS